MGHVSRLRMMMQLAQQKVAIRGESMEPVQCAHCSTKWVIKKGSGRKRGFCMRCMKVTCGSKACATCFPRDPRLVRIPERKRLNSGRLIFIP